jgi:uncharacterized protein (TIGR03545 family)
MKLLRWKYVLPRLTLMMTVVLSIHFGLDPLVRWGIVAGGESAVGAKVELASLRSSLSQGEVVLGPWQIANPRVPLRNLLQADRGRLQIDTRALLAKRLVVCDGTLRGLKWNTPRATSGVLDAKESTGAESRSESADRSPWLESGRQVGIDWLEGTRARLEQDLTGQLETPRVVQELRDRWPQQVAQMRERIDRLRTQTDRLQGQLQLARKNPLRSLEQIQQLQQPLQDVRQELLSVGQQLNQWPRQAGEDRQAMEVARAHDQQFLRDSLHGDGLDGAQLSEQLLGPVVAGRLETVLGWVRMVRSLAPTRPVRVKTDSERGVAVHFVGLRPQPAMHIRKLALTGNARLGTTSTDWIGTLTDVSNQPALLKSPTLLHMHGIGALDFTVDVALDRTGAVARDNIRIDCPGLLPANMTLGGGTLALRLAPGKTILQADLTLVGDQLDGRIHLKQPAVQIGRANGSESADKPVVARLAQLVDRSLAEIEQLETTVQLAGTLKRPTWRIQSNLGPQLAQGVNQAARQLLEQQATALQASIGKQAELQLGQLAKQREAARQKLLAHLGDSRQLVEQLAKLGSGAAGLPIPKLGKRPSVLEKMSFAR